jgi:hypothetical protein
MRTVADRARWAWLTAVERCSRPRHPDGVRGRLGVGAACLETAAVRNFRKNSEAYSLPHTFFLGTDHAYQGVTAKLTEPLKQIQL